MPFTDNKQDGIEWRPIQTKILDSIETAISEGYQTIILQAPPATGKSQIARAILCSFLSGYFCTPSKILQEQYARDFPEFPMLKGKGSYPCNFEPHKDCSQAKCVTQGWEHLCTTQNLEERRFPVVFPKNMTQCQYITALQNFAKKDQGITNIHLLYYNAFRFNQRDVVIFDEAHYLEEVMQGITGGEFTEKYYPPELLSCEGYSNGHLVELHQHASNRMNYFSGLSELSNEQVDLFEKYSSHVDILNFLITEDPSNVLMYSTETITDGIKKFSLTARPLFLGAKIRNFVDAMGEIQIFMSGTINPSEFCFACGYDQSEIKFIDVDSLFPPESCPIIDWCEHNSSHNFNNLDDRLPEMFEQIKEISTDYPSQKILVHTHSTKIDNFMKMKARELPRISVFASDHPDRNEALMKFKNGEATVFFTFSGYEGLDFPGDECRIVIFCKTPFLPHNDPFIKSRSEYRIPGMVNMYKEWQTALKLIQGSYRGMRSMDDKCLTFFLDKAVIFIQKYKRLFPQYFIDRLNVSVSNQIALMEELKKGEK